MGELWNRYVKWKEPDTLGAAGQTQKGPPGPSSVLFSLFFWSGNWGLDREVGTVEKRRYTGIRQACIQVPVHQDSGGSCRHELSLKCEVVEQVKWADLGSSWSLATGGEKFSLCWAETTPHAKKHKGGKPAGRSCRSRRILSLSF